MTSRNRPRRVLMTADTLGGVWTYALDLACALHARGLDIALATLGAPLTADQRRQLRALPWLTVREGRYRLEWMQDPWGDVQRSGEWLLGLEAELAPDIVHLNSYAHGALPWRAPTLVVGHSCVLSWWQAVHGESAPPAYDGYRRAVRAGLHAADLVVAPSGVMLDALHTHYGPLPRTLVIHNGRGKVGLAPAAKEPFLLAVGRLWDAAKNVAAVTAVAPRLPWPVCLAGDTRHPDGGTARLARVQLLGHLAPAELAGWYARASVYAFPARYEPFGLSVLEAALAGCALVLGDIPSQRELWEGAAVFVPPEDPERLVAVLRSLAEDERRRAELMQRARTRARQYSLERMAAAYLALYELLLREARQPARAAN
jgi:glycogen synthase